MPRINSRLARLIRGYDPLLAKLLPVCRSLESARNELRWIKESLGQQHDQSSNLTRLVQRRAHGEPLQYILGSEYFGDLEVKCRPGVLIPRQETAASVSHLVRRLLQARDVLPSRVRVLDLCTGTGCIPLLFHHEFCHAPERKATQLELLGVDISSEAIALATENHQAYISQQSTTSIADSKDIRFVQADIFAKPHQSSSESPPLDQVLQQLGQGEHTFDVLISNPPYISTQQYKTVTAQSVRKFEPRLALVPERKAQADIADGDQFYPRLWDLAESSVNAKFILFEVGDHAQAVRVATMGARRSVWNNIEIWRDEPSTIDKSGQSSSTIDGISILGSGNSRSVFAARGTAQAA